MARLHIYRKSIIKANYYTDTRAISVFLDDRLIGKMNPGNNMTIEVAPGPHKMVIRPGGLLRFPDTQEFTVDADSTDVYAAFRGRMARYIDPMIFQIYQHNCMEMSSETAKTTRIAFSSEDIYFKHFMWYAVTIDYQLVGHMDRNNKRLECTISKGKHPVAFESMFDVGYGCIDIKEDSDYVYVPVNTCRIVDIQSFSTRPTGQGRQVNCVFSRNSQFAGCAGKTEITLDGNVKFYLRNGETKVMTISEGKHALLVKANHIEKREFVVPENCNKVTIFIETLDKIRSIVME